MRNRSVIPGHVTGKDSDTPISKHGRVLWSGAQNTCDDDLQDSAHEDVLITRMLNRHAWAWGQQVVLWSESGWS